MSGNASRGPPDGISAAPPFAHLPPENRGFSQPLTATLARRHLSDGTLVLYAVSASHVEGRCCELARFGHPRNGRRDKMQIVFGLLCSAEGCPIAIEVFEG